MERNIKTHWKLPFIGKFYYIEPIDLANFYIGKPGTDAHSSGFIWQKYYALNVRY